MNGQQRHGTTMSAAGAVSDEVAAALRSAGVAEVDSRRDVVPSTPRTPPTTGSFLPRWSFRGTATRRRRRSRSVVSQGSPSSRAAPEPPLPAMPSAAE